MNSKSISKASGPYIAVFDSGVGGLTVLAELRKKYNDRSFLYLGDTARVPYGTKSKSTVIRYALEAAWFLNRYPLDCLVIGCNTVSAVAIPALRASYPNLPILEVVTPGSEAAVQSTESKEIIVLGTEGTIASGAYRQAIHSIDPEINVISKACPLFVPLAEENIREGELPLLAVKRYLEDILTPEVDTIVLGCTHYPLLKNVIQEFVGENIKIVDSAAPLSHKLVKYLSPELEGGPRMRIFTTDFPERFMQIGVHFLEAPIEDPTHIDLEEMFYKNQKM